MSNDETGTAGGWSEADSQLFIDSGRYYVPNREEQIETICRAIPIPDGAAQIVELCCGQGLLTRAILDRFPNARVLALDGSETMLEAARSLSRDNADRLETRKFDLASPVWRSFATPLHAVVSSLAIHHLSHDGKRSLFRDIGKALAPGGVFVVADLMETLTDEGKTVAALAWDEAVRSRAMELDGDLAAFERFRADDWNLYSDPEPDPYDKPSPLYDQLRWMEEAGLSAIEVHWMKAGHAIFSARKPGSQLR